MTFIILSVTSFCMETVPYFSDPSSYQHKCLWYVETTCVVWFCIELILRFIICPSVKDFARNFMNWVDIGAVLPFFLTLIYKQQSEAALVIIPFIQLLRVIRILKLSRHSRGLQILGHTLKVSCRELFLLMFFLSIAVVIFSSLIYHAEKGNADTPFTSIPNAFWWAIVTMTTLGYGDHVPVTSIGKIIGAACALCGVVVVALPVPVIVNNFSMFYSHAQSKMRKKENDDFDIVRGIPFNQPFYVHRPSIMSVRSKGSFIFTTPYATPIQLNTNRRLHDNTHLSVPQFPLSYTWKRDISS